MRMVRRTKLNQRQIVLFHFLNFYHSHLKPAHAWDSTSSSLNLKPWQMFQNSHLIKMAPKFVHQHCVILSSRFWSLNCFSLFSVSRFQSITHSEYLLTASNEDLGSSSIRNCFVHLHRVDTPAVVDCWLGVTSAAACCSLLSLNLLR